MRKRLQCQFPQQLNSAKCVYLNREVLGMCLAIPGKILDCHQVNGMRLGRVQFGGIVRSVSLDFVPEAVVDDYVMVHVGFAISLVAAEEADRTYKLLEEMGAIEEELAIDNGSKENNTLIKSK